MASAVIMTFNALTHDFRGRVEAMVGGNAAHYNAAKLRTMSLLAGIRDLRRIRAEKVVIAIESETARGLIGPLSLAAALTRAGAIEIIWPDLQRERLQRARALGNLFSVLRDTISARRALARNRAERAKLNVLPMPRAVRPADGERILYLDANISLGTPVGGSVGHTAGVIEAFLDRGFSVDYASVKAIPTRRPGVEWIQLEPPTLLALPSELNYYAHADAIEKEIIRRHQVKPWSFIYQRFSLHNFLGPALGKKLGIPAVVEFNGSEAWASEHWGTRLALHDEAKATEQTALFKADLVVTVSDPLAEDLRRHGVPDDRILAYPNCVDAKAFDPRRFGAAELESVKADRGIPREAFVVGFIGTFGQWHGIDFLAECIRDMALQEAGWLEHHRIHFMLVGDGLKMPIVREILAPDAIRRFVTLTGLVPQTDGPKYLACADLLVSPHVPNADGSEFFGSPTKLFEYMAMERPILAAALGQIGDVLAGRGATRIGPLPPGTGRPCGVTFEPGNRQAFRRELRRLVEDRLLAGESARDARAEVLARYTWDRHVGAIIEKMAELNLLERVCDRAEAPRQNTG